MQAFYFMKTLHLKAVEGRIVTVDPKQQELFDRLSCCHSNPLFVETFREVIIPFFNKHEIDYTIYREEHFPHILNEIRDVLDKLTPASGPNYERQAITAIKEIVNNKRI